MLLNLDASTDLSQNAAHQPKFADFGIARHLSTSTKRLVLLLDVDKCLSTSTSRRHVPVDVDKPSSTAPRRRQAVDTVSRLHLCRRRQACRHSPHVALKVKPWTFLSKPCRRRQVDVEGRRQVFGEDMSTLAGFCLGFVDVDRSSTVTCQLRQRFEKDLSTSTGFRQRPVDKVLRKKFS